MAKGPVEQFIHTLQQAEQTGDAQSLASLFTDDAQLASPERKEQQNGVDGALHFWRHYLQTFDRIRSEFVHVHEVDGLAVLEWASEGALTGGQPIQYEGVSILEMDSDKVKRFRTYYDSAAFLRSRAAPEANGKANDTSQQAQGVV